MRKGFTLIELVIVIVILGILAAVAIPRFIDLTGEARKASTRGGLGGLRATIAILYAQNLATSGGSVTTWPVTSDIDANIQYAIPKNEIVGNASIAVGAVDLAVAATTAEGWYYNSVNGKIWAYNDTTW